jgi:hypothetical protein
LDLFTIFVYNICQTGMAHIYKFNLALLECVVREEVRFCLTMIAWNIGS